MGGGEARAPAKRGAGARCASLFADGSRLGLKAPKPGGRKTTGRSKRADPPKGKRASCPYFSLSTKPSTKRFCKSAMTRSGGIKAKAQVAMTAP